MTASFVHPTAHVHAGAVIYPGVYVGEYAEIMAGAVIGAPGFGYYDTHERRDHPHGVFIGAGVHVFPNAQIAAGRHRPTIVNDGCRIDALVHIAHNVHLGEHVYVAAAAVVCGTVEVGHDSFISPNAVIRDNVTLHPRTHVALGACVIHNTTGPGEVLAGVPAKILSHDGPPPLARKVLP